MKFQHNQQTLSQFQEMEIERKFLVNVEKLPIFYKSNIIEQGYLELNSDSETRIRITDGAKANVITKDNNKLIRSVIGEYIPLEDGLNLLGTCNSSIKKIRYQYKPDYNNVCVWEIDRFLGPLSGFWMAEIELSSQDQPIEYPDFIMDEVTDNEQYKNSRLSLI
jgi:adenylate cyclase